MGQTPREEEWSGKQLQARAAVRALAKNQLNAFAPYPLQQTRQSAQRRNGATKNGDGEARTTLLLSHLRDGRKRIKGKVGPDSATAEQTRKSHKKNKRRSISYPELHTDRRPEGGQAMIQSKIENDHYLLGAAHGLPS